MHFQSSPEMHLKVWPTTSCVNYAHSLEWGCDSAVMNVLTSNTLDTCWMRLSPTSDLSWSYDVKVVLSVLKTGLTSI